MWQADTDCAPARQNGPAALILDAVQAGGAQGGEAVLHGLQLFGRMALPVGDLADDSQGIAAAVGGGAVAGEFPVGEVGVVLVGAGRFDDVDPPTRFVLSVRALGQLGPQVAASSEALK